MTLRVEISIIPFGKEEDKRIIDVFNVSNTGTSHDGLTCYMAERNEYKQFSSDILVFHKREDGAVKLAIKALEHFI